MFCDVGKNIFYCLSDQKQGQSRRVLCVIVKCITCLRSHCHRTKKCPHVTNKFKTDTIQVNYMRKPVSENYIVSKWILEAEPVFIRREAVLVTG